MSHDAISPGNLLSWGVLRGLCTDLRSIARELWFETNSYGCFQVDSNQFACLCDHTQQKEESILQALKDLDQRGYVVFDEKTRELFLFKYFETNKIKKGWFSEKVLNYSFKIVSERVKTSYLNEIINLGLPTPIPPPPPPPPTTPVTTPPPPQTDSNESENSSGGGGGDLETFGLNQSEQSFVAQNLNGVLTIQKGFSLYAYLKQDKSVNFPDRCFIKRIQLKKFDDEGFENEFLRKKNYQPPKASESPKDEAARRAGQEMIEKKRAERKEKELQNA